jgi:hypothetical protein
MAKTLALGARPASKVQRGGQRPNVRRYPVDGLEWGQPGWPDTDPGVPGSTATGAVAGIPGYYTPQYSADPANLAALATVTASPATLWTVGQYVNLADASTAHWNGTAWVAGAAPA